MTISALTETKPHIVRIPEFDGLRGVAILLVMIGHTLAFTLNLLPDEGLKIGGLGVLLFFVLSGYLITGLLRDELATTGTVSVRAFYIRRALRLFPALYVFLLGLALLHYLGRLDYLPFRDFIAAIFYLSNIFNRSPSFGHLWSLALEEQFYLLWPFLFLFFGPKKMLRISIAITLAVMLWRGVAISLHLWDYKTGAFYLRPWFRFDAIAIGCILALTRLPKSPAWLFGLSATALFVWSVRGEYVSHPLFITLQTALAATVVFSVITGGSFVRGLLSNKALRGLGTISYSLYLWQEVFTVSKPNLGQLRQFPINIMAVLVLAILSRKLIEEPFLKLRYRFGKERVPASNIPRAAPYPMPLPRPTD